MYYDINLKSNWIEPSKLNPYHLFHQNYHLDWSDLTHQVDGDYFVHQLSDGEGKGCPVTWSGSGGLPPSTRQTLSGWGEAEHNRVQSCCKRKAFRQTYLSQPFARKSRLLLRQYRNYPDTRSPLANPKISLVPLSPPFVNIGFGAIICSSVYLKKGHFKILLYISTFMGQKR